MEVKISSDWINQCENTRIKKHNKFELNGGFDFAKLCNLILEIEG